MKVKRKIISIILALSLLSAAGMPVIADKIDVRCETVKLYPSRTSPFNNGVFEGWGTSLCWWANRAGGNDELTESLVDAAFDEENGLGLDIARYNIGGGDDPSHNHITRSDSNMPGFAQPKKNDDGSFVTDADGLVEYEPDWTRDANQVNVMKKAIERNKDLIVEAFSNSPPYFMTNSGCSGGGTSEQIDNLNPDYTVAFAEFLAKTVKHFKEDEGISFQSIEPMNEPRNGGGGTSGAWNSFNKKQEGCNFNNNQSEIIIALDAALEKEGIRDDIVIAAMDDGSVDFVKRSVNSWSDEARNAVDRVDVHTYSSNYDGGGRAEIRELVRGMDKGFWMSEVDGGWGSAEIAPCLDFAEHLIADINGLKPSAWIIWQVADNYYDPSSPTDGTESARTSVPTWSLGKQNFVTNKFEPTMKYYVYGQYTRYIEPGDIIIETSDGDNIVSAYNPQSGKITIVAMNKTNAVKTESFDLSAFTSVSDKVKVIRTSGNLDGGEKWAELADINVNNNSFSAELAANSVTTFVLEPETGYISIGNYTEAAGKISYSLKRNNVPDNANVYTAIYKENGELAYVALNKDSDTFDCDAAERCTVKVFVWKGQEPLCDAVTVKSDGTLLYAELTGPGSVLAGEGAQYTLSAGPKAAETVWSVTETDGTATDKAEITHTGMLTGLRAGTVLVKAEGEGFSRTLEVEITNEGSIRLEFETYIETASWTARAGIENAGTGKAVGSTKSNDIFYMGECSLENLSSININAANKDANVTAYVYAVETDNDIPSLTRDQVNVYLTAGNLLGSTAIASTSSSDWKTYGDNKFECGSAAGRRHIFVKLVSSSSWAANYDYIEFIYGERKAAEITPIKYEFEDFSYGSGEYQINTYDGVTEVDATKNGAVLVFEDIDVRLLDHIDIYSGNDNNGSINITVAIDAQRPDGNYSDERLRKYSAMTVSGITIGTAAATPTSAYAVKDCTTVNITDRSLSEKHSLAFILNGSSWLGNYDYFVLNYSNPEEIFNTMELTGTEPYVLGNLYLPESIGGCDILWSSSDEETIRIAAENGIKPGIVTRGSEDRAVTLTGVMDIDGRKIERDFDVTVKANAQPVTDDDMSAYLFVHFVGKEKNASDEQIYFSVSEDGMNWRTINGGNPVLTSMLGEKGLRDPHIVRSPEGDKFFLIATDLSIYNNNDWTKAQKAGSRSIMIWESIDLVNWSEQRMVRVAPSDAGCTWAPESIYDNEKGEYMVFWASRVAADNYAQQRIYQARTRDFINFTAPEVYISRDNGESVIDTTFLTHNGLYYRFSKNESTKGIIMEVSDILDGEFTKVSGTLDNVSKAEGPTAYKVNGEDSWCLLLDNYAAGTGYKPFITDDPASGVFIEQSNRIKADDTYRHGTVIQITAGEYAALLEAYDATAE